MKKILSVILSAFLTVLIFSYNSLTAQEFSGGVNYSILFTDNPYRLSNGTNEYINSYQAELNYSPFENGPGLTYSFGLNDFRNLTDRSYYNHSVGLNYSFALWDTSHGENISLGAAYVYKTNTSGESTYSYNIYSLNASGNFYLDGSLLLSSGYNYSRKNYPSLYNLAYNDNSLFSRLSLFFETNTAIHFEIAVANRGYSIKDMTVIEDLHAKNMGMSKNNVSLKETNITQLRSMLKISQSLFENSGINAYYMLRNNLDKNNGISLTEFMYSDDDDLWDDPYIYEGYDIGSEFTQTLPWNLSLKLSAQYSDRRYKENLVDTVYFRQRLDTKKEFWFELTKKFDSVPLVKSLEAGFEYMYIINDSNENYFTYKNNLFLLKVGISF
ncbi:MAG: hypothetical protein WCJ01_05405 [Ignavibacteria bacterium]